MTTINIRNNYELKKTSFKDVMELFDYLKKNLCVQEEEEDFPTCFEDLDFRELEPHEITPEIKKAADKARNTPKEELIRI